MTLTCEVVSVLHTGQRKLVVLQDQGLKAVTPSEQMNVWMPGGSAGADCRGEDAPAALKLGLVGQDGGPLLKNTPVTPLTIREWIPKQMRTEADHALNTKSPKTLFHQYSRPTSPHRGCAPWSSRAQHPAVSQPQPVGTGGAQVLLLTGCTTLLPDLYQQLRGGCHILTAPSSWDRSCPARPGWKEGRKL